MNELGIRDMGKIRKIAFTIFKDYSNKKGVFKEFQFPPEYLLPNGMKKGSEEHLLFLTLTVSLDYMRDAEKLWKQSRDAWLDPKKRWIFNPEELIQNGLKELIVLFKEINDQRPNKDSEKIWFPLCKTLLKFDGNVHQLLDYFKFDAIDISDYLHKHKQDFPYLSGYKIKPLWLRMLNDTAGIKLKRIEEIPIPIDVHTARMTLKIVFNKNFDGIITKDLREKNSKCMEKNF